MFNDRKRQTTILKLHKLHLQLLQNYERKHSADIVVMDTMCQITHAQ